MNIILLGTPAAGKGTQAELLEKEFGLYHLSTGQLLRKLKDKDPEIREMMKRGGLIPDFKVSLVIEEFLAERDLFENVIIDGSPKNLEQYLNLKDMFAKRGKKFDLAIYLKISDQEALKRITARREDPKTGESYNLITNPPGPEVNLADLVQREDDSEEAVKERLKVQKVPEDLQNAMKNDGIFVEIKGEQAIEDIYSQIKARIENVEKQTL